MGFEEQAARQRVIAEALTWERTKYHHATMIKGVGCDCLTFLVGVGQNAGVVGEFTIPFYSQQFNLHHSDETYLEGLLEYTREVEAPQPADIVLWQFGKIYAHAALVIEWPRVIHAHVKSGVVQENADAAKWLAFVDNKGTGIRPRNKKFFTYW